MSAQPAAPARSGRDAVLDQFAADGIRYMFGNPGTVEQGLLDTLEDHPDLEYVLTLQEAVAVGAADAYARATRRPGLVQLHSGVGLGNGIGMLYQAKRGHAPLVVIAGEAGVEYGGMDAQMACDLVEMAKPVTKLALRADHPANLLRTIRRAIKVALTPPMGPVFVALPMDVLDADNTEPVHPTSVPDTRVLPPEARIGEAAQLLTSGDRPVVLCGDGVAFSGAQAELVRTAEALGAPVWQVDSSEPNMPAGHPLYAGSLGHMFGAASTAALRGFDRVLVVGTYLFPEVFPSLTSPFDDECRIVHIDLDAYEIGKNHRVDLGLVADPKLTLDALAKEIGDRVTAVRTVPAADVAPRSAPGAARPATVMDEFLAGLAAAAGDEELIVFDEALTASPLVQRHLPAREPGTRFLTRGGSLGVGIPGAIGLKLAHPDRKVVAFTGDGGSMYTFQAIWTARRLGLDLVIVICNNQRYELLNQNIDQYWRERGDVTGRDHPSSFDLGVPRIDFARLAEALGGFGIRVSSHDEARAAAAAAFAGSGPLVIDLATDDLLR